MNYNIEFIKSAKNQQPIEKIIDEFGTFDEETPVKQVFRPFLSEENVKPKLNLKKVNYTQTNQNKKSKYKTSNELLNKIKKDKKEFKSFFKIKNTIFNEIKLDKPDSVKKFEKGLKLCFFGKEGYITKKVESLKKIYKKRRNSIGIDTKIYAGTLDFLDLKSKKTSYGGRLDDIKRSYLFRSNNFSVARDRFSRREAMFIANNSKKKRNQRILSAQYNNKSPFITDYKEKNNFFNETMNILKNNFNTINSISSINENFINSYRKIPSSAKTTKDKKKKQKINKNRLHSSSKSRQEKNENKQNEDNIYSTYEYHNFKSDLYTPIHSAESIKFKKEINKTKKALNEKIKTMESPIPQLEGELYEIIDRINEFQNEEIIKKDFHKEKLKEDIFIITGIKLPEKKNKTTTKNFLKETIEDKDTKYKNAVSRFTKGLKNMDEETALKCVEEITPYTPKKDFKKLNYNVKKKKKVVEEKYIPDEKLRSKCVENDKKMERLTFSLDKLKVRYGL